MIEQENKKNWKVRTVKNYPEAHNHLFIGQILQITQSYVRLDCRTYHFGKAINNVKDVKVGAKGVRILPWNRIELINELPSSFDYINAELASKKDGKIALSDGRVDCVLSSFYDNRY
ncbi:MAG: hypothetical protein K8R02_00150 [Anaerohalosphaeraceae bacterium]|nr:hypothetical protein [Anaerohalosphaeraceae bacterium]